LAGNQTAWLLTGLLLIVSVVVHLLKGLDVNEARLTISLVLLLGLLKNSFYASSDPPSLRQEICFPRMPAARAGTRSHPCPDR